MEKLVGRSREIATLKSLLKSKKAELLAIYGRRRVGKTFLISSFFSNKGIYFEMTGIKGGKCSQQIQAFIRRLRFAFKDLQIDFPPKNWFEAFELLEQAIESVKKSCKIILFFDEFPWMDTHKSDLLKAFEYLWNSYLSRDSRIIAVICGSSVSWMIKKIIHNKAGLYGRLTSQIRLRPFTLKEIEEYFVTNNIQLDRKQIVELSMALGGIPKYLSYVESGKSAAQNIQKLCFTPGAPLTTEFQTLYESLFDNHYMHVQIIELLAHSTIGLTVSQISKKLSKEKGGNLSRALKELIASNFVQFVPFYGRKTREGRYRIVDEYSYFYLNWVQDSMYNYDESISQSFWIQQQSSSKFRSWAGYMFESICFKHIRQIVKALELTVVADKASYWSYTPSKNSNDQGGQIDLVIDRTDQCINLCEIKFWKSEFTISDTIAQKLNERRGIFQDITKTRKTIFNTLITPYGARINKNYLSSVDKQLNLDALFLEDTELFP